MNLSRPEILKLITEWLIAWNEHNLEEVMFLMNDEIVFENWTGETIIGKNNLQRSWAPWFMNHGNFKFNKEDIFVDDYEQKVLFSWTLIWPSIENAFKGKTEVRRGIDVLHFKDGKICNKVSYSKTVIHICSKKVSLIATNQNK